MKSSAKSKITSLIALGMFFALLPIITANLCFIAGYSIGSSEYSDDSNFDKKHLKLSAAQLRRSRLAVREAQLPEVFGTAL